MEGYCPRYFKDYFTFREASHIDFVHEKRHVDVFFWESPPLETSRTFFDSAEATIAKALFILQALRLSVVYISINVNWDKART